MAKRSGTTQSKASDSDIDGLLSTSSSQPADSHTVALAPVTRLDQILGHEQALGVLQRSMQSGRVHHAWIFAGPPGVGKRAAAVALGAMLLDPTLSQDLSGMMSIDPESSTQGLVKAGNHPDLHIITKELAAISRDDNVRKSKQSVIAKEVIEEFLIEPATRKRIVSSSSRIGKVFIVDEAELLGVASQNALLKTVEEPPEGTVIIFVTSSEDRLLTTIRSRCQRVAFSPLNDAQLRQWIGLAKLKIDPDRIPWLLQFAQGSPGLLLLAIENDLYNWQITLEPLLAAADKGAFSPELGTTLTKLVDDRAAAWVKINKDASKDAANKAWARRMFAFIADRTRHRMRAYAASSRSGIQPDDPLIDRWLHMLAVIEQSEELLWANVSLGLVFENLAAQMIAQPIPRY